MTGATSVISRLWFRVMVAPVPTEMATLETSGAVNEAPSPMVIAPEVKAPVPATVTLPPETVKTPGAVRLAAVRLPAVWVKAVVTRLPERVVVPALLKAPVAVRLVALNVPVPRVTARAEMAPAEVSVPEALRLPPAVSEPTVSAPSTELTAPVTVRALPDWVAKTPVELSTKEVVVVAGAAVIVPSMVAAPRPSAVAPVASSVAPVAMTVRAEVESALVTAKVPLLTVTLLKPTTPESVEVPGESLRKSPAPPILMATAALVFSRMKVAPASSVREPVPREPVFTKRRPPPITLVPPV